MNKLKREIRLPSKGDQKPRSLFYSGLTRLGTPSDSVHWLVRQRTCHDSALSHSLSLTHTLYSHTLAPISLPHLHNPSLGAGRA